MPTEIKVPDLGESIVEATLAEWLKAVGDPVKAGEPVLTLETDKVDLEVGATKDGVLAEIRVERGTDVKVGDVVGLIDESAAPAEQKPAPPAEKPASAAPGEEAPPAEGRAEDGVEPQGPGRVSPVARKLAEEKGIDLAQVHGSGAHGRVTKEDVERHLVAAEKPAAESAAAEKPAPPSRPAATAPTPATADGTRREERVRMSRRRRTIAERLVEAQRTAAMLTTFNEIDMSAIMALRARRKDAFKERHGVSLGLTSFFVKAAVGALKAFPRLNAEIDGDEMVLKRYYDIGIAVGAEDGLVVPVLRDADRMSFAAIEQKVREYVEQSQGGTLSLEDLRGGTFTITNGGVFGSLLSTPILNPPQVGILGLHKIEDRPIAVNGQVEIRPMMYVALSYDHRIVDGREAVQFLVRVKELAEDPETLLIEG
jgi:2-oxoglutarate dehydrogenase E2 component (dihydrolipoamide succinyltransferase)